MTAISLVWIVIPLANPLNWPKSVAGPHGCTDGVCQELQLSRRARITCEKPMQGASSRAEASNIGSPRVTLTLYLSCAMPLQISLSYVGSRLLFRPTPVPVCKLEGLLRSSPAAPAARNDCASTQLHEEYWRRQPRNC